MKKVAFITGAGGYIGSETARTLAKSGIAIAVCDINEQTVFLVSDKAGFITGQTYVCDGGRTLSMKGTD